MGNPSNSPAHQPPFDPATWAPRDRDQKLHWSGSPEHIFALCTLLQAEDRKAEKARPRWLILAMLLGGGTFIAGMGLHMWWITITGLGLGVYLGRRALKADAKDIEDRKVSLVRALVEAFEGELREGMPIEVTLDLRGHWHYKRNEHWLTLTLPLANRIEARLSIGSSCKRKVKHKRKYTRIKDKLVETLTVQLTPPKGHKLAGSEPEPNRRLKVGPLELRRSAIKPRAATFVFSTDPILRQTGRIGRGIVTGMDTITLTRHTIPRHRDFILAFVTSYHLLARALARASIAPAAPAIE